MRLLLAVLVLPAAALAQTTFPTEFPADAQPVSAEALRQRVSGKVFKIKYSDGTSLRLEYKNSGYAFIDTSRGFRDTGKWRVEGEKLCIDWQKIPGGCSDVRMKGDVIHLKRVSNGEVVVLVAD